MSEVAEEMVRDALKRRSPPRRRTSPQNVLAMDDQVEHIPRPNLSRAPNLHDGRFQRGLPGLRINLGSQNLERMRRPRHQHSRRRNLYLSQGKTSATQP